MLPRRRLRCHFRTLHSGLDRFHTYLPGWEMPKNTSRLLTNQYGFITDYLAAAFRELALHHNRIDWINKNVQLGTAIEGRDERAVKKSVSALLKILHPVGDPTGDELDEYVAYAIEGRRRIKEQLNKRKTDDEYANIALSFVQSNGAERVVWCPESKNAQATQQPARRNIDGSAEEVVRDAPTASEPPAPEPEPAATVETEPEPIAPSGETDSPAPPAQAEELKEQHYRIHYGDIGRSYDSILGDYLVGAKTVTVEDPYIRMTHQVQNFVRFCETVVNRAPPVDPRAARQFNARSAVPSA